MKVLFLAVHGEFVSHMERGLDWKLWHWMARDMTDSEFGRLRIIVEVGSNWEIDVVACLNGRLTLKHL